MQLTYGQARLSGATWLLAPTLPLAGHALLPIILGVDLTRVRALGATVTVDNTVVVKSESCLIVEQSTLFDTKQRRHLGNKLG